MIETPEELQLATSSYDVFHPLSSYTPSEAGRDLGDEQPEVVEDK